MTIRTGAFRHFLAVHLLLVALGLAPALPLRAAEGDPGQLAAGPRPPALSLRTGEHDGYSRLVFDWPDAVDYRLERHGEEATLVFDRPASLDLGGVSADRPSGVLALTAHSAGQGLMVGLTLRSGVELRHFRSGSKVVVDVLTPTPVAATAPAPPPETVPAAAAATTAKSSIVEDAVAAAIASLEADRAAPSALPAAADSAANLAPAPAPAAAKPIGKPTSLAPSGTAKIARRAAPDDSPDEAAPGRGAPLQAPLAFDLDFGEAVAAAAFRRGPRLWLVFDHALQPGLARELERRAPALAPIVEQQVGRSTVLRFTATADLAPELRPRPGGWRVDIRPRPGTPSVEPDLELQSAPIARLLVKIAEPGELVVLEDPDLGDRIHVLPVRTQGLGLEAGRAFPEFRALPTYQGLAVVQIADDLRVGLVKSGLQVTTPRGLVVSRPPVAAVPPDSAPAGPRLFDLAAWRHGPEGEFETNRLALQKAAAGGANAARARRETARFFFAHGLATEALSALDEMTAAGDGVQGDPELQLIRAASHAMNENTAAAMAALAEPSLAGADEALTWRAALAAQAGHWGQAAELFQQAEPMIGDYVRRWRNHLRLLAAEARLGIGDTGGASLYLSQVQDDQPDEIERARFDLLDARRFLADGRPGQALEILQRLKDDPHRPTQARARLVLIEQNLKAGETDRASAIAAMERLRFLWRGDAFEWALLERLSGLYLEAGDYRQALLRLREAASVISDRARAEAAAIKMRQLFAGAFGGSQGPPLSAIKAVALYEEFKELTPLGSAGISLLRALAQRMAEVELLDRADRILTEAITPRLRGSERAEVGLQLAGIRLRDERPAEALAALDRTALEGLPPDLVTARRQLRARILAADGQAAEALALLAKDSEPASLRIIAEIHWNRQDWPAAAASLARLLPEAPPKDRALSAAERQYLVDLAVAQTLADNHKALVALGRRWGAAMSGGAMSESFVLLTSDFGQADITAIPEELRDVERVQAFISSYRGGLAEPATRN